MGLRKRSIVLNDAFTEDHEVIHHEMLHALQPSVERHTANPS